MSKFWVSNRVRVVGASVAVIAVAGAAYGVSAASGGITTTTPASALVGVSSVAAPASHRAQHRRISILGRAEHAVITIYTKRAGSVLVVLDRGKLTSISSSSVTLVHLDGTSVTAAITSTTKFRRSTEPVLASELAAGDSVAVELVQSDGTLKSVVRLGLRPRVASQSSTSA